MKTQHKVITAYPQDYDPDIGDEVDVEITFTVREDKPEDSTEIDFAGARYVLDHDLYSGMEHRFLDTWAEAWLQDEGFDEAIATVDESRQEDGEQP